MIRVTVNINGMNYNLKGEKDEKYLLGVANFVDTRIKEILSKKASFSTTDASVLAAVNIADELYECDLELDKAIKIKEAISGENSSLKKKVDELSLQLENINREKSELQNNFQKKEEELHGKYNNVEVKFSS
ncbi:MAG: cell division protein ZapA, partial [Clostridium beijerinckii]|nr:cell division protein ZapA [Clostridium beijerinckii]